METIDLAALDQQVRFVGALSFAMATGLTVISSHMIRSRWSWAQVLSITFAAIAFFYLGWYCMQPYQL